MLAPRPKRSAEMPASLFGLSPKLTRRLSLARSFLLRHRFHLFILFVLLWIFVDTDSYILSYISWTFFSSPEPPDPLLTHQCPQRNYSLPIVVVVPLIASQISRLEWTMLRWARADLPPCHNSSTAGRPRPELAIYFDRSFSHKPTSDAAKQVQTLLTRNGIVEVVSACFADVKVTTANLSESMSKNGGGFDIVRSLFACRGSNQQFEAAFRVFGGGRYRHMFFMEPDTWPIRPGWLDSIEEESRWGDFWVRGTIIRYPPRFNIGWEPYRSNYLRHINGNAIYSLDDQCFNRFRELVAQQFGDSAYDVARALYLYSIKRILTFQVIAHRFQISRVMVDLGVTQVHEEQLVKQLPGTYLVHAKDVFNNLPKPRATVKR